MPTKVYLAFDERMALHKPLPCALPNSYPDEGSVDDQNVTPVENPHRIIAIYNKLMHLETHEDGSRCFMEIPCVPIDRETVQLTHSKEHYDKLLSTMYMSDEELRAMTVPGDLYFCRDTFMAARLACGGVVECVNAVTAPHRRSTRAMAIVRPPGHHACYDEAMGKKSKLALIVFRGLLCVLIYNSQIIFKGFCYLNNVAVAAKYAVHTGRADRVLILDWDIHHGNGIQDLTYDNPDIFYLSIHRASFGSKKKDSWFYPGTGRPREVGVGDGAGTNLNICWGKGGMGNAEYARAFHDIVLPLLLTFKPALIIVACGLDAAKGDLLGDCGLTSDMFYTMTRCILEAAPETPIVTALEGGYNLEMSAECMVSGGDASSTI